MQDFPGAPIAALVVWEPILETDSAGPKTAALARVSDRRSAQFWDKRHQLSQHMGGPASFGPKSGAKIFFDMGEFVWDFVAVYAPGFRWKDSSTSPAFAGAPVIKVVADLKSQISAALAK